MYAFLCSDFIGLDERAVANAAASSAVATLDLQRFLDTTLQPFISPSLSRIFG